MHCKKTEKNLENEKLGRTFAPAKTKQADNDQVITFDRLPANAQTMLKQNFADKVPLVITADWDEFKVMYTSGEKNHKTTIPRHTTLAGDLFYVAIRVPETGWL